ncbi:MAG: extracellular solute-binding protein [Candidatus Binatota bacterium]|nr:extracellular solute-binding protein [Candidatus Binatota bacterium]
MQFFLCLAFLFGLGGDWLFPSNARGQAAVPTAAVIEGAKKEGQVVFYTPLNINDSRPLLQRFEQKYPFIKTDLLRMSAEPLLNRIVTEDRAGRNVVDVINNTVITALKKARLLQAYRSPEFPAYLDQFKDPEGSWASLNNNYYVLGYNTKLVSAKEAPTDWQDLLHPKWRGKIGMDQEEFEWFAATTDAWGRERAGKYHRALAQQQINWRKGHTLISQLIAAGEFPVGIVYAHRIESMKKAGAPIEWIKTVNPVFLSLAPIALAAKAPHPNAARLLLDFLLSKDSQQFLRNSNRISGRADVEPLVPEMHHSKLKLTAIDPQIAEDLHRHASEFREIYFR